MTDSRLNPVGQALETSLGQRVFALVGDRVCSRCADISKIGFTGYSFEEWLNWETFLSCVDAGLKSTPRPRYSTCGVAGCKAYADLLVESNGHSLFVETKIIHTYTMEKYYDCVNDDTSILKQLEQMKIPGVSTLQLVLVCSRKPGVATSAGWRPWLSKINCWSDPTNLEAVCALNSGGEILLRGWER